MIRKGLRPGFRLSFGGGFRPGGYRRVWKFRRSWIAITVLAAMDAAFLFPAILTFRQALGEWGRFDSLFDLVIALFLSAWLVGWSMAPLIMTAILLMMLFGREVLIARQGTVELFLGLPFLGLVSRYDVAKMRNLRIENPVAKSGSSWRGSHLVFDYGANPVALGSDVGETDLTEVKNSIHMVSGMAVRRGDALPGELQPAWETDETDTEIPEPVKPVAEDEPLTWSSPSTLLLIIANLVPIAGTLFLGWKLSDVMVLYWAESAVIGFFNLCKIIMIGRWVALFAGPFFVGHFGGFMAVHFLFIYTLFVKGVAGMDESGGDLAGVFKLFAALWPALAALFISHGYSFVTNFVAGGEYRKRSVKDQMSEPYVRIIFMQFVLILGGGLTLALGQVEPVLIAVIGLKIYFDIKAHIKEHKTPG